jgi:hypothetical protein
LIEDGKIKKIPPYSPFPELGIMPNRKHIENPSWHW